LLFEVIGVVPEALDAVGFVLENVEGGDAGCRDGGRMRRGEEEGAGAMVVISHTPGCKAPSGQRLKYSFSSAANTT